MTIVVTLANGDEHHLVLANSDADEWMRRFGAMGTSALGDWMEVIPDGGAGRTFIRSSTVVRVQLIDDHDDDPQAVAQP